MHEFPLNELCVFILIVALLEGSICCYAWFFCQQDSSADVPPEVPAEEAGADLHLSEMPHDLDRPVESPRSP